MKGKIELYNISFLILKVELHFNLTIVSIQNLYFNTNTAFCNAQSYLNKDSPNIFYYMPVYLRISLILT